MKNIANFISYLSTALADLLLLGAILMFYNATSDRLKLGLIGLFTFLFSSPPARA